MLTHWSYCSLALSHRIIACYSCCGQWPAGSCGMRALLPGQASGGALGKASCGALGRHLVVPLAQASVYTHGQTSRDIFRKGFWWCPWHGPLVEHLERLLVVSPTQDSGGAMERPPLAQAYCVVLERHLVVPWHRPLVVCQNRWSDGATGTGICWYPGQVSGWFRVTSLLSVVFSEVIQYMFITGIVLFWCCFLGPFY